jgi:hypothetical protein
MTIVARDKKNTSFPAELIKTNLFAKKFLHLVCSVDLMVTFHIARICIFVASKPAPMS